MRFELYKILDPEHADDLRKGHLYMNTLDYFRSVEGNDAQNDFGEGMCGALRKEQLKQYGIYFDEELTAAIKGGVVLISDYYGLNNLFCLYKLPIDEWNKTVVRPDSNLRQFDNIDKLEKVAVRVKGVEQFFTQVHDALQHEIKEGIVEYGIYGDVEYSNLWSHADGPGTRSVFHKDAKYAYQNEWRLCLLRHSLENVPYRLSVGSLTDITEVIPLDKFLMNTAKIYPGYTIKEIDVPKQVTTFEVVGTINTVNHLMFSYMEPAKLQATRSDQAQATWHYAQYLKLKGELGEIDPYLESRMEESQDFEHLELLVQHRLDGGEWIKSTDAFMFFIKNLPHVIRTNPDWFFSFLHTILMVNQKYSEAALLYKRVTNEYHLSEEMQDIMRSDFLFALGFYDVVIPLYEEMQRTTDDPILDFYLAVSYLQILEIEKADYHLSKFEKFFSHSPIFAQKRSWLRSLVRCFRDQVPIEIQRKDHVLQVLEWDEELNSTLINSNKKSLYLGVDYLYLFEKSKKWHLLDGFTTVVICPLNIARLIDLYAESGDPTFYRSIIQLRNTPNLRICSPEIDYYLAIDAEEPELLPYIKMERALFLQDTHEER